MLGEGAFTVELIIFLDNGIKQLKHQTIDRSRPIGTIIVHTQLRGKMHMICINIFCFCLIAGHLDILRYFIFAFLHFYTVKLWDEV
jgi:hypothetical protein